MQGLRDAVVHPVFDVGQRLLRDRTDAGQKLARKLTAYAGREDVVVLGLPRGGVPVAYEVAKALHAPLDIFVVRKLGVPGYEELAMGAIASGGTRILNDDVIQELAISEGIIDAVAAHERQEIERRECAYRGPRAAAPVLGKTVIVVDDGVATGATLRAALAALRTQKPAKLIAAVGVAPPETCAILQREADELVCLLKPDPFLAVGYWFAEFAPTTDEEVRSLLARAHARLHGEGDPPGNEDTAGQSIRTESVRIKVDNLTLDGDLSIPHGATGIVLFAHGSGSSRFSPRNRFVARVLQEGGMATLLFDLLTAGEEEVDMRTRRLRFDIELLAGRLTAATDWILHQPETRHLHIGYFGSSTGAAAALIAAVRKPEAVGAVVSRGGRPDLAMPVLPQVTAPTLLIVGGNDLPVTELNEQALAQLHVEAKLEIVPGAGHLFEEPGKLETVAHLARDWFQSHLGVE